MYNFQDECSINITFSTVSSLALIIFSAAAQETIPERWFLANGINIDST